MAEITLDYLTYLKLPYRSRKIFYDLADEYHKKIKEMSKNTKKTP